MDVNFQRFTLIPRLTRKLSLRQSQWEISTAIPPRGTTHKKNRRPLAGSPACNEANYREKLAAATAEKREETKTAEEGGGGLGDCGESDVVNSQKMVVAGIIQVNKSNP
jgi:hypothetical protein